MTLKGALRITWPVQSSSLPTSTVSSMAKLLLGGTGNWGSSAHQAESPVPRCWGEGKRPIRAAPAGPQRKPHRTPRETGRRTTGRQPISGHEMPCLTSNESKRTGLRLTKISDMNRSGGKRVLRSFVCTAFGRSWGQDLLLCGGEHSVAQKVESGTTIHGPLDGLQPVDLSLDRTSAPGQRQGGMYGIAVLTQAPGKALEAAGLSG